MVHCSNGSFCPGEIAVFYRVQKQAEILEKVFERAELPYVLPAKQKEDEDPVPERPASTANRT